MQVNRSRIVALSAVGTPWERLDDWEAGGTTARGTIGPELRRDWFHSPGGARIQSGLSYQVGRWKSKFNPDSDESPMRTCVLSATTGEMKWQFLTGAAVTQAANFYEGYVYAASDDGNVYCLKADDGSLTWKYKAAPADRWLISYDRMASLWPVRTDVLVDNGVAYFAAGVFPHDGVYVHAVRANNAQPVWQTGGVPYAGGGVSGYPLLTKDMYHCPVDLKGFNRSPMFRRSEASVISRISCPSIVIRPASTS